MSSYTLNVVVSGVKVNVAVEYPIGSCRWIVAALSDSRPVTRLGASGWQPDSVWRRPEGRDSLLVKDR